MLTYCKKCLTTSLRPNAWFNAEGICSACQYYNQQVDYQQNKTQQLQDWISFLKKKNRNKKYNRIYDCIVGVSGGKDSTRQAHWVKESLGMRPLLICCAYPPLQMSDIGANNLSNLVDLGFDLEIICPAPITSAQLSLESFIKFGNICKSTEMALFATVPRVAIEKKIPFIFWGENPALQVGDFACIGENEFDGNNLRKINTLKNNDMLWMTTGAIKQKDKKLHFYEYPDMASIERYGINIIYLGPAWNDWSNEQNATYASLQGLTLRPDDKDLTGDISGASMLDEEFTNINMMIKYYKFGFGRATDLVNEKIRMGLISRSDAIKIVEEYDGVCDDQIIEKYTKYVGITTNDFWKIVYRYTNRDLFIISDVVGDRPRRKFKVGIDS